MQWLPRRRVTRSRLIWPVSRPHFSAQGDHSTRALHLPHICQLWSLTLITIQFCIERRVRRTCARTASLTLRSSPPKRAWCLVSILHKNVQLLDHLARDPRVDLPISYNEPSNLKEKILTKSGSEVVVQIRPTEMVSGPCDPRLDSACIAGRAFSLWLGWVHFRLPQGLAKCLDQRECSRDGRIASSRAVQLQWCGHVFGARQDEPSWAWRLLFVSGKRTAGRIRLSFPLSRDTSHESAALVITPPT